MTQNNEDGTEETDGYGKEEYDNYLKFTEYQYMSQNGAYAPPEAIASEKREYINKPKGNESKDDEDIGREYFEQCLTVRDTRLGDWRRNTVAEYCFDVRVNPLILSVCKGVE